MRHSTPEEQELYRDMLARKSVPLVDIGDLTVDDISLVLDLLDVLWSHSEGYSENAEEWWEDNWVKEDSYEEFCDRRDEAEDNLRRLSNYMKDNNCQTAVFEVEE